MAPLNGLAIYVYGLAIYVYGSILAITGSHIKYSQGKFNPWESLDTL